MSWLANQHIAGTYRTSVNAYKKYLSTRPPASVDSNKRVKNINFVALESIDDFNEERRTIGYDHTGQNPFGVVRDETKHDLKEELVAKMKQYRPTGVSSTRSNIEQCLHEMLLYFY